MLNINPTMAYAPQQLYNTYKFSPYQSKKEVLERLEKDCPNLCNKKYFGLNDTFKERIIEIKTEIDKLELKIIERVSDILCKWLFS
jgi:hypothetical protein